MARTRRTCTRDFKLAAVHLIVVQGYSVAEAGRSLGLSENLRRIEKQKLLTEDGQAFPGRGCLPPSKKKSAACAPRTSACRWSVTS